MSLNPAYEAIGKGFVQQYYVLFDDPSQRPTLAAMYNVSVRNDVTSSTIKQLDTMFEKLRIPYLLFFHDNRCYQLPLLMQGINGYQLY